MFNPLFDERCKRLRGKKNLDLSKKGYKVGIKRWSGRLGNNIYQIQRALYVAKTTDSIMSMPNNKYFNNKIFDFRKEENKNCNVEVKYDFYQPWDENNLYIRWKQLRPLNDLVIPLIKGMKNINPLEKLVIWVRGEDNFPEPSSKKYVPAPLCFYKKVIEEFEIKYGKHPILIVSKDRRNPCINQLIAWRKDIKLQCKSYIQDFNTIASARWLVMDCGTYGQEGALLNPHLQHLYVWAFGDLTKWEHMFEGMDFNVTSYYIPPEEYMLYWIGVKKAPDHYKKITTISPDKLKILYQN
jgi:hypothetical protein